MQFKQKECLMCTATLFANALDDEKIHKKYNLEEKTDGDFVVKVENHRKPLSLRGEKMDVIDRAIEQKLYMTDNPKLKDQTWQSFEKSAVTKKIWIFGAGRAAGLFWERYHSNLQIEGVIDNDERKHGKLLKDYVGITEGTPDGELIIKGADTLYEISAQDAVVVISSVRYYEDIAEQMEAIGIQNNFVMVIMEANENKNRLLTNIEQKKPGVSEEEAYAIKCIENPIEENKVLVYIGNYGSHGNQISRKLVKMNPDLDIVWIIENQEDKAPEGIRTVLAGNWKEYIRELETAHVWIYGDMIPQFAYKRHEQIYIQTKHWASITLKKFYWDLDNYLAISGMREHYLHNNKAIDYIFVGSRFDEESCRSGFDFTGECVHVGSPRTDVLFQSGVRAKVCSFYGIDTDKHIALYSPTFRAAGNGSVMGRMKHVSLDFKRIESALRKKFGGEWVIFLRVHPDVAMESPKVQKPSFVIDTSYYHDSQELVAASDITITDYSSIMFEPAFIGKPVFLYAPDKEEYVGKERELLIDYDSLPFPISESNDELIDAVAKFDYENYKKRVDGFLSFYGIHEDGHASERAAEFVVKLLQ